MTASSATKLSIVIRCRNEANGLRNVFAALRAQQCDFDWEVVLVDNESEDDTRRIAEEFGARIVPITRREFTYGRAINLGVRESRGELVMLLSAHALPIGSNFLTAAVAPFDDPQVAAARCLLVTSTRQLQNWHQPKDIQYKSAEEQRQAEAGTAWVGEYPTGGCCIIRRAVWEDVKYDERLESNEDKLWASHVLAKGWKIRSCAEALWMYTREYGRKERLMRETRQHLALYRITRRAPLSVGKYLWLLVRTLLAAPLVAVRYVFENVAWNTSLVSIPWRARREPETGSFAEFDQKR
ncbi:MAG TPA: glycosyltransferase family 2 protein [Blastocatellia bacterium]|nr:glycosyltransferase family 2 protein [Blastocatellia bacterium]HMV83909.1 glycosyltransferase family 2 protein [Blastocatellia bacterium]HMY74084.1 glycosyltransferase family 2 protein [Blastocatellia bacterium]HMZ23256.1 glycosyltransferase family 2 protein [Blastocatellia bacterium]HNG28588.1 glycosyltransferase family 2 protein [Blastocatellia bacterium]